jgi:hypothetical protein
MLDRIDTVYVIKLDLIYFIERALIIYDADWLSKDEGLSGSETTYYTYSPFILQNKHFF